MSPAVPLARAPFDPRAICNAILDETDAISSKLTNLALQKLLYFAHGLHLVETKGTPLVTGVFEAWQYGPVHPAAYQAFKRAGAGAIAFRAVNEDPFTGESSDIPKCADRQACARVRRIVSTYAGMTAGRLVELAHAKDAPWSFVVDKARTETILGLRITNEIILARFKYHKVSVGERPRHGEPRKETPLF